MPTHERLQSAEADAMLVKLFEPIKNMDTVDLDDIYDYLGRKQARLGNELRLMQAQLEIVGEELQGRDGWLPF